MSVRSRYTGTRREKSSSYHHSDKSVQKQQPQSLTDKAKNAIKTFSKYVAKNQKDYARDTGDTSSLSDDLALIPIRVVRKTGEMGREEQARIQRMKHRDSDEEISRYMAGRSQKKEARTHSSLKVIIKPQPKPKKRNEKVIYLEYDPEAEVE
jgi:hypothetical protein